MTPAPLLVNWFPQNGRLPPSAATSAHFPLVLATATSKKERLSFPKKMRVVVVSFSVLFYDKSASSSIEYHGDEGREDGFSSQKYTIMN